MKKLYKIILSFVFIVLLNTFAQTPSYSHGIMTALSIFTSAMAQDHTAEREVIKQLKVKIYNLGGEPIKKKTLFQSDKKYIVELKKQLSELEKQTSVDAVRSKIEKEIEELGGKPITKVTDIDRDEQVIALRKQLENLKIIKAEKDQAIKEKKEKEEKPKKEKLQALKKEIENEIISLGAEPVTKKNEFEPDEELKALQNQLKELKKLKAGKEKEERLQAIKEEIEDEIIALGEEPVTKKNEFEGDEDLIALENQLEEIKKRKVKALKDKLEELKKLKAEKEKEERLQALKGEIEDEIIALGAEPVTKNIEFIDDKNIQALGKQLEQLKLDAEKKKAAEIYEQDRQKVIQVVKQEILALGETPISEFEVNNEDEFINALKEQVEKIKQIKEQEEKEIAESIPDWFIMMPKANEKVIYVRGTAVVDTLQGSIDSATNAALRELGKKLETRLNSKVNETLIQAGIGEDITTKSEMNRVSTLVVKEVTISGYEISQTKMFKMDNNKYRSFILLEYPVGNLYKAFLNRLEDSDSMQNSLQAIKDTDTFKELEEMVAEFTGA
tara:strand:- start:38 stop:1708 length:1671 start_codon:yes stop_codon:yes gene_type:complete